jgi:CheY-like chemotaxis protein/glycine cleavage system H lipoate-binding protein
MSDPVDVLIVEDEPVVVAGAGRALASQGIGFADVGNVTDAAARLEQQAFRVLLVDLKLPGRSGFEMVHISQQITPTPQVVMITGYATIDNSLEAFQLGAFDFLPKPFDVTELVSVVQRGLCFSRSVSRFEEPESGPGGDSNHYYLGRHAWAVVDPDGSVTMGVAETFSGMMGELESIELPATGEPTLQGHCFCRMRSDQSLDHRVWAPLSGRVIATNQELDAEPGLIDTDPFSTGWLTRIIPTNLNEELSGLSQRLGREVGA